jgi:LEA14-like dessication related protein
LTIVVGVLVIAIVVALIIISVLPTLRTLHMKRLNCLMRRVSRHLSSVIRLIIIDTNTMPQSITGANAAVFTDVVVVIHKTMIGLKHKMRREKTNKIKRFLSHKEHT